MGLTARRCEADDVHAVTADRAGGVLEGVEGRDDRGPAIGTRRRRIGRGGGAGGEGKGGCGEAEQKLRHEERLTLMKMNVNIS